MVKRGILFSALLLFLSGCGKPFQSTLIPQGEVARTQYELMILSTGIMVFVVVVVSIIFFFVITKFRRRKGQEDAIPEQVEGNHKLEFLWTIIPIMLLLILAVPTIQSVFTLADTKEMDNSDAVVVNVTANLYWWEFEYKGEQIITSQELVIPVGEKIYLNLTAGDIKHSFWVPSLAGKMDTNPENINKMWMIADKIGTYNGFCTELCGPSHALMQFKVKVVSQKEFDSWLIEMNNQRGNVATTSEEVMEGQEIFNTSCITCHAVDTADTRPQVARTAPNLANFGDREKIAGIIDNTPENIKNWLENPDDIKPGNKMQGTYGNLTDTEITALTAYLSSLKVK